MEQFLLFFINPSVTVIEIKDKSSYYFREIIYWCSVTKSCLTLYDPMHCRTPGSSLFHYPPEFAQIHVHWVSDASNHLILCCPLLLPSGSFLQVFSSASGSFPVSWLCIRWPKYWSFSSSISPSSEYSRLISFWTHWFDLHAIQGTLKSLLQHHNLKHQFFSVQPSLWSNSHICTWQLERP